MEAERECDVLADKSSITKRSDNTTPCSKTVEISAITTQNRPMLHVFVKAEMTNGAIYKWYRELSDMGVHACLIYCERSSSTCTYPDALLTIIAAEYNNPFLS